MAKSLFFALAIFLISSNTALTSDNAAQFFTEQMSIIKGDVAGSSVASDLPAPKCGTPVTAAMHMLECNGINLPSNVLEDRPTTLPLTFGGNNVLIHYTGSGQDAPYQTSVDTLPQDGVPDFVNRVSEIFEYVKTAISGYVYINLNSLPCLIE